MTTTKCATCAGSVARTFVASMLARMDAHGECFECLFWRDVAAEERAELMTVWTSNGKRQWNAGGAVVFREMPKPYACSQCRSESYAFKPDALMVIVRKDVAL